MSDLLYRAVGIRAEDVSDEGLVKLIASTDAVCDMGGYREVLTHAEGSIDMGAARSVLLNHDRDQIIGGIRSMKLEGGALLAEIEIAASARTIAGTSIRELVRSGALAGVSIGYQYERADADYDERSNTVTARKWALREITLTPTQADVNAHVVRSLPESFKEPAAPAANQKGNAPMSEEIKPQGNPPVVDEKARAAEIATLRTELETIKRAEKLRALASSHKIDVEGLDLRAFDSIEKGQEALMVRMAEQKAAAPAVAVSVITRDAADKANEAAVASVLALHDAGKPEDVKGAERGSILDIVRRHAARNGQNASDFSRADLAAWALGKAVPGSVRSVNVTSSNFNNVVLAAIVDKAIFNGFNNFAESVSYNKWTGRRSVVDFKQFSAGALDSGNLVETAEGIAFPELTKAEGYYHASLALWGATMSLSYQALVNDDMGEFMRKLAMAGAIAQRTIDKKVYTVLAASTWTGNVTASVTSLATAGSLDAVRKDFEVKTGPAGEVLGNKPKYLIVPSVLRTAALQATTSVQGNTEFRTNTDLEAIVTPHLAQHATPANSTFYLAGDPRLVDTMVVSFLQGAESPQTIEYDAGAAAARKWKIMLPFVAALASTTVNSTVYIPGMQQATS